MCFKSDNKNFIRIKLYSEMRGLSDSEKLEKYQALKKDVHKRLSDSYNNCSNRIDFYKEVYEVLSFYDGYFLFVNLVLEKDFPSIINALIKCGNIQCDNDFDMSYSWLIEYFCNQNEDIFGKSEKSFCSFLEKKFIEITSYANREPNQFVNGFVYYLGEELSKLQAKPSIIQFVLFVKLFNCTIGFNDNGEFNNSKAILLYDKINKEILNKDNSKINTLSFILFYKDLKKLFYNLFVNVTYMPLFDNENMDYYKRGYLKQRKEFSDLLNYRIKLASLNDKISYLSLFSSLDKECSELMMEKIDSILRNKIANFDYPSLDSVRIINKLKLCEGGDSLRLKLSELIYFY